MNGEKIDLVKLKKSEAEGVDEGKEKVRRRVLVVDDDLAIIEQSTDLLAMMDCDVVVAHDGKEGLEALKSGDIDIVLSDFQMPNMDEKIRKAIEN